MDSIRTDLLHVHHVRPFTIEENTAAEFIGQLRVPRLVECDFVFLVSLVTRMSEALCEVAIARQQEQTLALGVEPANVEEPRKLWREEIEDGVARVRVAPCGNKSRRLVQKNGQAFLWPNEFVINLDVIAFRNLCAEIGSRLAIDRDPYRGDQLVAMPARAETRSG